jgi:hypothetical protein
VKRIQTGSYHCAFSLQWLLLQPKGWRCYGAVLALVIANLCMESFELQAMSLATKKPAHWYRYVDDTFVVWTHGKEELRCFLQQLNSMHPNMKFTMEVEHNITLPFLDVLVSRRPDSLLGHTVYRKPTHMDLYLRTNSDHHPQKQVALETFIYWAKTMCASASLVKEISHLKMIFRKNGCSNRDIKCAFFLR